MNIGYLYLFVSLTAFGTLGIFHKIADHPGCRPKMTALWLFFWGCIFSIFYTAGIDERGLEFPARVILIGSCTGVVAALSLFVFQMALRYGKISTSWLIVNLHSAVPVLISISFFGEKLSSTKCLGIVLVFIAIILMWMDKKRDFQQADVAQVGFVPTVKSKWFPLMMITFFGGGLASTGSKFLVEANVSQYVWQFLIVLYASGCITMVMLSIFREPWPNRREVSTALVMGLCSVVGNSTLTMALKTVKGAIAYPINQGSLLIVVLAGIFFFREKIHPVGITGIIFGICAVVILVAA